MTLYFQTFDMGNVYVTPVSVDLLPLTNEKSGPYRKESPSALVIIGCHAVKGRIQLTRQLIFIPILLQTGSRHVACETHYGGLL